MLPTSNDIARFRSPKHKTTPVLNVVPKVVIATARVNQATFTYPVHSITVDTTSADWLTKVKVGQQVTIGTSPLGDDVMYGVVRKLPNSTTLYIDAKGLGDSGYPQSIVQPVQDDYFVTIYKFRPPWGLLSSIRAGVFYKKWDLTYTDQLLNPDPICKMGTWRQAFVDDSTGKATLTFDCSSSYVWDSRKTLGSPTWNVDGGTIVTGTIHTNSITVEFDPGFYEIECEVQDNTARKHKGYRYVWINTRTPDGEFSPFSYKHTVRITTDNHEVSGRKMTFEVDGYINDLVFPGQGYLFTENPEFFVNGQWERLDNEDDYPFNYVGYRVDSSYKVNKNLITTTITTEGPGVYGASIVSATQQIVETQYPKNWAQCSAFLSNPIGAVWYSTYWHAPYLISGHDFEFDVSFISQYRRRSFQFSATQVGAQLSSIAEMVNGIIGWKSNGTMKLIKHPMYLNSAFRVAMDTQWTLLPEDIQTNLEVVRNFRMPTGQVYGSAFSFNGTEVKAFASLAPGYAKAQGANTTNMTPFTVSDSLGQNEVNRITGHAFAMENRKEPDLGITMMKNMDLFEPINADSWVLLNVEQSYDPEGYGWVNKKMIPTRVTRSWSIDPQPLKSIQVEFQIESFGQPGVTVPINRGGADNWYTNLWNPSMIDLYQDKMPDLGIQIDLVYAWNEDGILARTESFTREQVDWEKVTGYVGALKDGCLDYTSPFFGDPTLRLGAWFVTDQASTIRVYYVKDLFDVKLSWQLEKTLTAGTGYNGKVRIASTEQNAVLTVVAWKDRTGVSFSRTHDPGHTWSTAATIGVAVTDPDHDNEELGLSIKGDTQVVIAPDGTINVGDGKRDYFLYQATTPGGSFSLVPNQPAGERAILGCAQLKDSGYAVVGYEGPGTTPPVDPLSVVTFDVGGYSHYNVGVFTVGPVGPTGNSVYNSINVLPFGGVQVIVLLQGEFTFQEMTFDTGVWNSYGTSQPGPYNYSIRIVCYSGFGTSNQTVVSNKTFNTETFDFDPAGWRTTFKADELDVDVPIDAVEIVSSISRSSVAPGVWQIYIDNIDITADFLQRDSTWLTRSVSLPGGTWGNITPVVPIAPTTPYGVGMKNSNYSLIGSDEQSFQRLYYSSTGGSAWATKGKTKNLGVKRNDEICVFFGYNTISVSKDNGTTQYSRNGNWSYKVGKINTIKGFLGVF